jgi:Spy/CpxP family protein refolding chaperone
MSPKTCGRILAVLALLAGAAPALAQRGFPWWKDEKVVKELGLTPDQSTKIDAIWRATSPRLRQNNEELTRQESELSRLIATMADETVVVKQIDKVEAIRAGLNKTRTLMLLHMVRKLTPEQRARFNPVHEQWRRDNPRPPAGTPPPDTSRPTNQNQPVDPKVRQPIR